MRFILFFLVVLPWKSIYAQPSFQEVPDGSYFFISHPRSGSHLTQAYIETLTDKLVFRENKPYRLKDKVPFTTICTRQCRENNPPVFHFHDVSHILPYLHSPCNLLVVLRNYKESLIRESISLGEKIEDFIDYVHIQKYMDVLALYEAWPEDIRLLIYYEDLIQFPTRELSKIAAFFDFKQPLPKKLLEKNKILTLQFYEKQHKKQGGSMSKGLDLLYHSKNTSEEILEAIDDYVKSSYEHFFDTYLKRYATKG